MEHTTPSVEAGGGRRPFSFKDSLGKISGLIIIIYTRKNLNTREKSVNKRSKCSVHTTCNKLDGNIDVAGFLLDRGVYKHIVVMIFIYAC